MSSHPEPQKASTVIVQPEGALSQSVHNLGSLIKSMGLAGFLLASGFTAARLFEGPESFVPQDTALGLTLVGAAGAVRKGSRMMRQP